MVDHKWAERLVLVGQPNPRPLNLAAMAYRLFAVPEVSPERALLLGSVFNPGDQQGWPRDEQVAVNGALRAVRLQAEDGSYQSANCLGFPQDPRQGNDGAIERARAAVAPPSGRLCASYANEAVDFAQLARSASGYRIQQFHEWLKTAGMNLDRAVATLRYLADRSGEIDGLVRVIPWLPRGTGLAELPAFQRLTSRQQNILRAGLDISHSISLPYDDPKPPQFDSREVLDQIRQWWEAERDELIASYDEAVYPEEDLFNPGNLSKGRDEDWFTMIGLAMFQTIGRIQPEQSRSFVQQALRDGWWQDLATIGPNDTALQPYVERLLAWSEPEASEEFMEWRRRLVDLCRISRHLGGYRELFELFPQYADSQGSRVSLSALLRPQQLQAASRRGIDAANISRSMGMGANWMIRELARHEFYGPDEALIVAPYGWSPVGRVRDLLERIGVGPIERGIDPGWHMHRQVTEHMQTPYPFGHDGDLPLHVITLAEHQDALRGIMTGCLVSGEFSEIWPNELINA